MMQQENQKVSANDLEMPRPHTTDQSIVRTG